MKDPTHHMTKFLRKMSKEEEPKTDEVLDEFRKEETVKQKKKQGKARIRKEPHVAIIETPQEKNREMKKRTPVIRLYKISHEKSKAK
jgi:hypothetical protein